MSFEDIKRKAKAQWEAMQNSPKPRILVGTATCGMAAGAEDILHALDKELVKNNVEADIIQVGCIGLCYAEPLIEVIKPGKPTAFYGNITPELVAEIIREWVGG